MVAPRSYGGKFWKIEEGVEFTEDSNNRIPGGKVVNITYLMILRI